MVVYATVADGEEFPGITVRRVVGSRGVWVGLSDVLNAACYVWELGFDVDVPVGIVFHDEGGGDAGDEHSICLVMDGFVDASG